MNLRRDHYHIFFIFSVNFYIYEFVVNLFTANLDKLVESFFLILYLN